MHVKTEFNNGCDVNKSAGGMGLGCEEEAVEMKAGFEN